ncbi:MAG: hypothetical protein ACOY94_07370 [Bacillota bacterium]
MAVYRDAAHMKAILEGVFERAQQTEVTRGLRQSQMIVAFIYHNPEVTVLMDGRSPAPEGEPIIVKFDDLTPAPDVSFELAADVGHQFWKGKLNVPMALARGQIKAKGQITKALKLLPLLPPLYQAYRDVLNERGETDLLDK